MAVVVNPKDSRLRIKFKTGVDLEGNDVFKTKTLSRIKSSAIDEDVVAIANELSALQQHEVSVLTRVDEKELTEVI